MLLLLIVIAMAFVGAVIYIYGRQKRKTLLYHYKKLRQEHEQESTRNRKPLSLIYHESGLKQRVEAVLDGTQPMGNDFWYDTEKLVNDAYPDFLHSIDSLHRPSEFEKQLCLLTALDLQNKDIAQLTHHSNSSVTIAKKRLFTKMFGQNGTAADFDSFIAVLVKRKI